MHCSRIYSKNAYQSYTYLKKLVNETSFYYANVTGLRTKTTRLFTSSTNSCFDVVCLTETWLCGGFSDAELFSPEYLVFRRDRHSTLAAPVGGGVLCAVHRDIPCMIVDVSNPGALEVLCVRLTRYNRYVYVVVAYIPPNSSPVLYESFTAYVDQLIDIIRPSDELLVFGDFNLPSVEWGNEFDHNVLLPSFSAAANHVLSFIDGFTSSGLAQTCGVANDSGKFLDLVFSSDPDGTTVRRCLDPLVPETRHHPALLVLLSSDPVIASSHVSRYSCYNFRRADFVRVNDWLSSCDWSSVFDVRDIDEAVSNFYNILFQCFSECVPFSISKGSQSCQPWLGSSLKHLKNLKCKAWKRFCISGSDVDYMAYSNLRNQFLSELELSYGDYVDRMKLALRTNPKEFWKFVNSKRSSDSYPSTLRFGGVDSNDPLTIANFFAKFFSSAFNDSSCDISYKDFTYLTKLPPTSLLIKDLYIDEATVLKHISGLADSFSAGPDGIPAIFLKKCALPLVSVLCFIFNLSIDSGVFPSSWKNSIILPLHKKGNKCEISNYRPIANLSCVAKLFESLICDALYFHCKPFLGSFQHGFMKGKSTTTNLIEFTNYCTTAIEAGNQVDCIFTDFSKAFDRINHTILAHKLSALGFPPLFVRWLSSYLSGRTQQVSFRGVLSDIIANSSGVPQGSHLGPLLFIIYINDISMVLRDSRILCYADDAKIFRVVSSERDCELINSDLDTFQKWCSDNYLPLNVEKCFVLSFTRKRSPLLFSYSIDGRLLSRLDKIKDLGVVFNTRLSFENHIDTIVNKANATLGFVKRWAREFEDPHVTKVLYCTFVRPILEYASPVWSPFYSVHVDRLEAVQRRFLRFALRNLPWDDPLVLPPYIDRLKLLSLHSLEERRIRSGVLFAFDCLQGVVNSPELLGSFCISVPARSFRDRQFLHLPFHRTNYGMFEPVSSMSRHFNLHFHCIDFHFTKNYLRSQLC